MALMLMSGVRAPDGGPEASLLLSESPAMALGAAAIVFVMAAAVGALGARAFGTRSGLFIAGLVLVWPAWESGTVIGILRRTQSGSSLQTLGIEGLIVAAATIAAGIGLARFGGEVRAAPLAANAEPRKISAGAVVGPLVGLMVGMVGATACARTEMPGQAIASAFVAGLLGAMSAMLFDSRVKPEGVLLGLAMLAFIGPMSGALLDGTNAVQHVYDGTITPLARLTPLHWAAGLLLGVPVGASWASGLVKKA